MMSAKKKYKFLLLDTGPIIKLFELGLWDIFIDRCNVTLARTVAEIEAQYAHGEKKDIRIDLEEYEQMGKIKIEDVSLRQMSEFINKFPINYKETIHSGEKETLAFFYYSQDNWMVCSADKAVYRVLGAMGKAENGVSLEKILNKIGLSQSDLEPKYTEKFKNHYTKMGSSDFVQGQGFKSS